MIHTCWSRMFFLGSKYFLNKIKKKNLSRCHAFCNKITCTNFFFIFCFLKKFAIVGYRTTQEGARSINNALQVASAEKNKDERDYTHTNIRCLLFHLCFSLRTPPTVHY